MKLSTIVAYHNLIEEISPDNEAFRAHRDLDRLLHTVRSHAVQLPMLTEKLGNDIKKVNDNLAEIHITLDTIKTELRDMIESMQPKYFADSYRLYQEMQTESTEYILNRRPKMDQSLFDFLRGRVLRHADWHHPCMVIRPGIEPLVSDLVACDPLYLVDIRHDLLQPAQTRFTPEYQRRLRSYVINESGQPVLGALPDGQFNYVLAYNFFNYRPLELFKTYFAEIFTKLKPGGCLAMTFNNCDRAGGVILAENVFQCYTPGKMIMSLAESYGFEINYFYQIDAANAWLEIKRPGTSASLRGGQSLAKVVAKSK